MTLTNFLIIILIVLQPIIFFIGKKWISSKIKMQYDKLLEDYKQELLIKQKSELIADLLSEWLSKPTDRKKLNQLTFEAFLWLPSDIANDLSALLSHKPESKNVRDIISEVRILLLGEEQKINPNNVIIFSAYEKDEYSSKQKNPLGY